MEIYHNIAAKNSDSDEGHLVKSRRPTRRTEDVQVQFDCEQTLPHKATEKISQGIETAGEIIHSVRCDKMTQNEEAYEVIDPPRTISCYSKNYELPTIASRMKQAAKYYLNTFNFKVSIAKIFLRHKSD